MSIRHRLALVVLGTFVDFLERMRAPGGQRRKLVAGINERTARFVARSGQYRGRMTAELR